MSPNPELVLFEGWRSCCKKVKFHQASLGEEESLRTECTNGNANGVVEMGKDEPSSPTVSDFKRRRKGELKNLVILLILMIKLVGSAAQESERLDSKIKMFLENHCSMQNETLEQEEFESFMSCVPSHGAGIVNNLGQIPEYKSPDTEAWSRGSRRVILTECRLWPQDKKCQETTFRLIEKCFEMDQKFVFYFMFALTDVICQRNTDLFVKFWQKGGDTCLGNHIRSLKKDFADCFTQTNTESSDDVQRNLDSVMQCFRHQFDKDCGGADEVNEVLDELTQEIKSVYRETSRQSSSSATALSSQLLIFLAGWVTFLL